MVRYYELLSDISTKEFEQLKSDLSGGTAHPKEVKMKLAREMVQKYYDEKAADQEHQGFNDQFSKGNAAKDRILISKPTSEMSILDFLHQSLADLKLSKSDFRRLITQNAVRLYIKGDLENEKTLSDPAQKSSILSTSDLIKIGKRNWIEI